MPRDDTFNPARQRGGIRRQATIQERLYDAYGRELERRTQAGDQNPRERLTFNSYVDGVIRTLDDSGNKDTARALRDWRGGKQGALLPERAEEDFLRAGQAAGRFQSGLGIMADTLNPFSDTAGLGTREEQIQQVQEGSTFLRDTERLLGQTALEAADVTSLGGREALTTALIQERIERGDFKDDPVLGKLGGMDARQIMRRGEGGGEAIEGRQVDEDALAAAQAREAEFKDSPGAAVEDLLYSGVNDKVITGFQKAGQIAGLLTGAGYVSRFGNVLKATRAAKAGLPLMGRALQNPIINLVAAEALISEGEIRSAELLGEEGRAGQLREGQDERLINSAVFATFMPFARVAGRTAQNAFLRVTSTSASRARMANQTLSQLPNVFAKARAAGSHVVGKAGEFMAFGFVPTVYRPGADGKTELSPWVTTILNPAKIGDQLTGKSSEWLDALSDIVVHAYEHAPEELIAGGLTGALSLGHARHGETGPAGFKQLGKLGPLFTPEQGREIDVKARRSMTPEQRRALREQLAADFEGAESKPAWLESALQYVTGAAEAQRAILQKRGELPKDTGTLTDALQKAWEGRLSDGIFEGKLRDKDASGLGVEVELIQDPERPNQPGRKAEVLDTFDVKGGLRMSRVRFEDGSIGVVPNEALRTSSSPQQPAPAERKVGPDGATREGFGVVRDRETNAVGQLLRMYEGADGKRLADVVIGKETHTLPAERLTAEGPIQPEFGLGVPGPSRNAKARVVGPEAGADLPAPDPNAKPETAPAQNRGAAAQAGAASKPAQESRPAEGVTQETPQRRFSDVKPQPNETPAQRRERRLRGVAAGRKRQAFEDTMTRLGNRRAFDTAFQRRSPHGDRVVLVDVTGLKAKNDTAGQEGGDKLIQSGADLLREVAKDLGLSERDVFRVGGDEYAILASPENARRVSEALRERGSFDTTETKDGKVSHELVPAEGASLKEAGEVLIEAKKESKARRAEAGELTTRAEIEGAKPAEKPATEKPVGEKEAATPDVKSGPLYEQARKNMESEEGLVKDPEFTDQLRKQAQEWERSLPNDAQLEHAFGETYRIHQQAGGMRVLQERGPRGEWIDVSDSWRPGKPTPSKTLETIAGSKLAGSKTVVTPPKGSAAEKQAEDRAKPVPDSVRRRSEYGEGKETGIIVGGQKEKEPARYAVVPLDLLLPSHDPTRSFEKQPGYPEGLQPRDYKADKSEQHKVMDIARGLNPEDIANTSPRATQGTPIVAWDADAGAFVVLSGNGRTMAMQEALRDGPTFGRYMEHLQANAGSFFKDAKAAENGGALVRIVDINPRSERAIEFARQTNLPDAQRQSPLDRAAAEGKLVSDKVLESLDLDGAETFAQAVNSSKGDTFRNDLRQRLGQAGADLFDSDGKLTETGKEFVDGMLTVRAGFSPSQVKGMTKGMRRTVSSSVVQWLQLDRTPETKEEASTLRSALDFVARELEGGKKTLAEWEAQGDLFNRTPLSLEQRASIAALQQFVNSPRKMREALQQMVVKDSTAKGQGTLIDVGPKPFLERLRDAFGVEVSDGVIRVAQDTATAEQLGFPTLADGLRHDELTHTQREELGAVDPISLREAPAGGLSLPLSSEPRDTWSGNTASRRQIIDAIADLFNVPIRIGRSRALKTRALGWFNTRTGVVRLRHANDVVVAAHEAGHSLEKYVWPQVAKLPQADFNRVQREMRKLGIMLYGPNEPHNGYASEGFAEFMRLYLGRPELAKQHAPKMLEWFDANFKPERKDFKRRLADIRQMHKDFVDQGDENRILSSIVKKPRGTGLFAKTLNLLSKEKWVEELAPLERLVRSTMEANPNLKLEAASDPYKLADALRGTHAARATYMAERGMIDPAGRVVGPALAEAMKMADAAGKKYGMSTEQARDRLRAYVVAKRVLDLARRGIRSGNISMKDALNYATRVEREMPEFLEAGKRVWEWNRGVLTYARQLGAISEADYNAVMKRARFYIPMSRVMVDGVLGSGGSTVGGGKLLKGIRGSDRDIHDPFRVMVTNAASVIRFAHRRAILQRVADLSRHPGIGHMIEKVDRDVVQKMKPLEEFRKQLEDAGADLTMADETALLTWYEPKARPDSKDPIVPIVRPNGKVEWFQVERNLYDSLTAMDPYRLPAGFDLIFGVPARLKRLGTTGLRASFSLVTNPIRDLFTMHAQSTEKNPAKVTKEWLRAQAEAVPALFGKKSHYHELWDALGGTMSQPLGQDMARTQRLGENLGRSFGGKVKADLKKGRVLATAADFLDLARDVFQVPEAAPRIAELRLAAQRVGWDPAKADTLSFRQAMNMAVEMKRAASQVTVDFASAGKYARIVNAAVPFFNVAIQGPRHFGRAWKRNPLAVSLYGTGITAMTLALWQQNRDEEWYKDLPWREKFGYWHIQVGDQRVRIPRPFEIGNLFATMPEATVDAMYREDPRSVREALDHVFETTVPDAMPVIPQEVLEQAKNEDSFRNAPIVPKNEERLPAEEQFGSSTSVVARKLGKLMGWSPRRIDHAINGIFGGLGSDVARGFGVVKPRDRDYQPADMPVIGRLFAYDGVQGYASQSVQDFFNMRRELTKRSNSKDNPATPGERAALRILERAAKRLKVIRKTKVDQSSLEERSRLQVQMREISQQALRRAGELIEQEFGAR